MPPLVSIITPSYNQAEYLEATIQSVLGQLDSPTADSLQPTPKSQKQPELHSSQPFELEYIIVDGASTDDSPAIIQRYSDHLAWWTSEPDRGQAEAINKGFGRAQGEFIAWLNSDDLYLPGAIAAAVEVLQADPSLGLVFGDAVTIDAHGAPLNRLAFGDWGLDELLAFRIICQPAVFMRRSLLEQAGTLDPDYHFLLDHQLWIRLAQRAPIRHVPGLWAAARHHPAAKNVAQASAFAQEAERIYTWMQTQPALAPAVARQHRRILGGMHRLSARYLLDGGLPGPSLRAYAQALRYSPRFALQHWRRMLFALLALITGPASADRLYHRIAPNRPAPDLLDELRKLPPWPGLGDQGIK